MIRNNMLKKSLAVSIGLILLLILVNPIVVSFELESKEYNFSQSLNDIVISENPFEYFYEHLMETKNQKSYSDFDYEKATVSQSYVPHDPIIITSDAGFTPENGVTSGSGTENDPYIIEGWGINATGPYAILISHTTAHFIVRNCLLENAEIGIELDDLPIGVVSNTICMTEHDGILINNSNNLIINDSTLENIDYGGLKVVTSSHITITDCVFNNARIMVMKSPNNIFRNNSISSMFGFGVIGESEEDYYQDIDTSNTILGKPIYYLVGEENQEVTDLEAGFFALVNCKGMTVSNLNISMNIQGMLLVSSEATINNCEISYCAVGIHVFEASNLKILDSKIYNNDFGFYLEYASDVSIKRTEVTGSSIGFDFRFSHDINVQDCTITYQGLKGFQIWNSWNTDICSNIFSNNWGGIGLYQNSRDNKICYNQIYEGYLGIVLGPNEPSGPHNNTIHHNGIHHMEFYGIGLSDVNDNLVHHNGIHHTATGIIVTHCERCEFHRNNIHDNSVGLEVGYSVVDATYNWWGSKDGPSGIGPGSGDSIKVYDESTVLFEPWLKRPVLSANQKNSVTFSSLLLWFFERFPILRQLLGL